MDQEFDFVYNSFDNILGMAFFNDLRTFETRRSGISLVSSFFMKPSILHRPKFPF